ncbi:asparaginyl-tRNA synthetase class IIb [Fadolivirus algeromassiliense]|jgi:asparaginyl-tRNA synthetase|uniref:asparagine--tRNA ligase n=1 Tax=Fadolivirus FV1/VV64 TaxID=3070911 RepID=A0A7D3USK2_9VIRU|nr:asparaginyl-tRNA synthetase class IIb [Fadolivirus algeromassiliense]QKF93630.1 asparaginyl-tRNA synthetase class IIb [Fadolivirus FV1/VV64]
MAFEGYKQSYTDIKELYEHPDKWIGMVTTVCGWIQYYRSSGGKGKNNGFVKMKDGSCLHHFQVIFSEKSLPEDKKGYFDELFAKAKTGVSLKVTGLVVKSPAKGQPIEMQAHEYQVLGDVMEAETYPISKNELTMEFLRTMPHLRPRTDTFSSIMRVKSCLKLAAAEYFDSLGFHEVQVPCITDNECESGANPFTVTTILSDHKISSIPVQSDKQSIDFSKDFFKKPCYLTVSGQLHLESLVLGGLSKAFCWTTAFRAEPSTGPRHLGEFWMLELEFCFGKLEDNMRVNEGCIKHCLKKVLERCRPELEFLQSKFKPGLIETLEKYATKQFAVSTHQECVKMMLDDIASGKVKIDPEKKPDGDLFTFKEAPGYADDLSKDHERYITEVLYGGMPVFCRYFPAKIKAFYMPKIDEGAEIEHVDGFDMLMPEIGEVIGGSQRETDYNKLLSRMKEMGVKPESLEFYLDLRKYGTVPHGGSGIGIDRLLMLCTGVFNIRDMVPFPRAFEMCYY